MESEEQLLSTDVAVIYPAHQIETGGLCTAVSGLIHGIDLHDGNAPVVFANALAYAGQVMQIRNLQLIFVL